RPSASSPSWAWSSSARTCAEASSAPCASSPWSLARRSRPGPRSCWSSSEESALVGPPLLTVHAGPWVVAPRLPPPLLLLVVVGHLDHPLGALEAVEVRQHHPGRPAVLRGERCPVDVGREQRVGVQHVLQVHAGRIPAHRREQHVL